MQTSLALSDRNIIFFFYFPWPIESILLGFLVLFLFFWFLFLFFFNIYWHSSLPAQKIDCRVYTQGHPMSLSWMWLFPTSMSWELTSLDTYLISRPNSGFFFDSHFLRTFLILWDWILCGAPKHVIFSLPMWLVQPRESNFFIWNGGNFIPCQFCDTASALFFIIFMVIATKIELLIRKVGLQSVPLGGEPFDYSPKLTDCPGSSSPPSRLHAFLQWSETSWQETDL